MRGLTQARALRGGFFMRFVRCLIFCGIYTGLNLVLQDQSSWSGSAGHAKGDANVFKHFGGDSVWSRRAVYKCNGVKVCEFTNRSQLRNFRGWERDDTEMQPFWTSELDANEAEFSMPDGPMARYCVSALR
jgi:hypothetical protein